MLHLHALYEQVELSALLCCQGSSEASAEIKDLHEFFYSNFNICFRFTKISMASSIDVSKYLTLLENQWNVLSKKENRIKIDAILLSCT